MRYWALGLWLTVHGFGGWLLWYGVEASNLPAAFVGMIILFSPNEMYPSPYKES